MYRVALTRISHNAKTGPIPVSTTESRTCPKSCGQYDTCYAKYGRTSIHWKKIDAGERGVEWSEFCEQISCLPRMQLWRHNVAGDLPGDGVVIDHRALNDLVTANKGRRGFTYTHYPLTPENIHIIETANASGFAINVSCDSLTVSDLVSMMTGAPQSVVLPSTDKRHSLETPAGRKVVVCPATYRDDMNCARCGICADTSPQRAVIGFPAHGAKKRVIDLKLLKENNHD